MYGSWSAIITVKASLWRLGSRRDFIERFNKEKKVLIVITEMKGIIKESSIHGEGNLTVIVVRSSESFNLI